VIEVRNGIERFSSVPHAEKVQRIRRDNECRLGHRVLCRWDNERIAMARPDETSSLRPFVVSSNSLYPLTISFHLKVKLKRPIYCLVLVAEKERLWRRHGGVSYLQVGDVFRREFLLDRPRHPLRTVAFAML
jgi:hypothetical protein